MKNKKNAIMLIMIITISMVLLTWNKSYSYKMDNNEIEETEVERKEFGIYLQESGTTYKETDAFPNKGYLLNTAKTECHEYGSDNVIPQAVIQSLTNGVIDGSIIVQSTKSMYCKIYFDKDETPTVNSFNITGKTSNNENLNNGFTNQTSNLPITFDYTDTESDVVQYCVSETNNSDSCSWIALTGKSGNYSIINTADGSKIIYLYLKDKANNISTAKTTNITVDRTKPVVKALTLTGTQAAGMTLQSGYTHTTTVNYTSTITETNMEGYCVGENTCNSYTNQSKTISGSLTIGNTEGSHTVVISVKDKAGNTGSANSTITLDLYNPTISLTQGVVTETSITVNVAIIDTHNIDNVTCTAVGNNEAKTGTYTNNACTFSGLNDDTLYSITVEAMDVSGRKGTGQINVTTLRGKLTRENIPSKLFNNVNPNGLSNNLLGDMYRFVGTKATVDNWICFGYNNINTDCKSETSDYMYRIIGITEDGQMKLIKEKEIWEGNYNATRWYSSYQTDVQWPNSDLYKRLNGEGSGNVQGWDGNTNLFINSNTSNVQYIKSGGSEQETKWYKKIENHTWTYGDTIDVAANADAMYRIESNFGTSLSARIGLMYVSDYYYSYATDGNDSSNTNCRASTACKDSWMNVKIPEWLMTRVVPFRSGFGAWRTEITGQIVFESIDQIMRVRPVFYLNSDVKISSGAGTSSDPFIIAA